MPELFTKVERIKKQKNVRAFILTEAKRLFREKGYSAVSMSDLVASIGLTKPTIYYYFNDKESLFAEVTIDMIRSGSNHFQEGLKEIDTFKGKLYHLALGFFEFSPTSLCAMLRDCQLNLSTEHMLNVQIACTEYLIKPIQAIFDDAVASKEIYPVFKTSEIAHLFLSWLDTQAMLQNFMQKDNIEVKRTISNHLVNGFVKGFQA